MKLHNLTSKALEKLEEIIDLPITGEDLKLLVAQKDACATILTTAIRADENRFRQKNVGTLDKILAAIRAEEIKSLPLVVDQSAARAG